MKRLLTLFLLAGCGSGNGLDIQPVDQPGGAPPPPTEPASIHGEVLVFIPESTTLLESEPNDDFDQAHFLGAMKAGQSLSVVGSADAAGDPLDGYRLTLAERAKVTVSLQFEGKGLAYSLGIWDFSGLQFVRTFGPGASPVEGEFYGKGLVDLVLTPTAGAGEYLLRIDVEAPGATLGETEPNDALYAGQPLGEVLVGDAFAVAAEANPIGDAVDSFVVTCPEPVRLDAFGFIPLTGLPQAAEFDVELYDITAGEAEPPLLAAGTWDGARVDVGATLPAGTLVQFVVRCRVESAKYRLVVEGFEVPEESAEMSRALSAGGGAPFPTPGYDRISTRLLAGEALVLHRDGAAARVPEAVAAFGCRVVDAIPGGCCCVGFDVPAGLSEEDRARYTLRAVRCLSRSGALRYAEPNRLRQAYVEPDDALYNLQWHYPLINLPQAWEITTGDDAIIVAVIDTGQSDHPDLAGRQIAGYDFISGVANALDGDGIDSDPTDPGDSPGGVSSFHGTHVAGTIGAATDNGSGVAGVTWATRIMHLRTLGRFGGSDFDISNAIRYAARLENNSGTLPPERAHLINMSLGGPGTSQTFQDAITAAWEAGVTVFAASGNENTTDPRYPASYEHVVSVGSVDLRARRAPYSNYGTTLDIVAPGGDTRRDDNGDGWRDGVLSTLIYDGVSPPDATYAFYQGTSMACPHAVGVAALMLAVDPTLTPDEIEAALKATAQDLGAVGVDDEYAHGLIDAHAALLEVAVEKIPVIPPQLALSNTSLQLLPDDDGASVVVSNTGGEPLQVDPPAVTVSSPQPWLSATRVPSTLGGTDTSAIDIAIDRTGLEDGIYFGRVEVTSNGGSATIQVLMRASSGPAAPPDINVFVRVVNVETGEVARQQVVNPSSSLDFDLSDVPPGRYRIEAGTDDNSNGVFCESGELCGAYPIANAPLILDLGAGEVRGPFVFTVGPSSLLPAGR